jgi:ubiquinone/menaquinone biosynthesis C-methylase UbiE
MNDYQKIFEKRANEYHWAMQKYPDVRSYEFESLIGSTNFSNIKKVLDIPSGGGYLKKYLPKNIELISADFSEGFTNQEIQLVNPTQFSYCDNSFDLVLSLSGLHHLNDVPKFVNECLRVLKENGSFIFSDVKKDTAVDFFLNEFVNKYNSLGHNGMFFTENSFNDFPLLQQKIVRTQYNQYPFVFKDKSEMICFFSHFFGLDKANENIIYDGICDILGITTTENNLEVNWGLIQFEFKN